MGQWETVIETMIKTEIWNCGLSLFQLRHSWGFLLNVVENKGKGIIAKKVNTVMVEYIYIKLFSRSFCVRACLIVHFNTFTSWNFKGSVYQCAFWMGFQLHKWSLSHEKQYCFLKGNVLIVLPTWDYQCLLATNNYLWNEKYCLYQRTVWV